MKNRTEIVQAVAAPTWGAGVLRGLLLVASLEVVGGSLAAQLPDRGELGEIQSEIYEDAAGTGRVSMDAKSNTLQWIEFGVSTPNTVQTVGFNRPGDAIYLGNRRYLISGLNVGVQGTGAGVFSIIALKDNPKRIEIETTQTYAQVDPYSLYFNASEGRLYVYDVANKRLVFMPFVLPGILPSGDPWLQVATSSDFLAFIYDQYQIRLGPPQSSTGVTVIDSRVRPSDGYVSSWQVDFVAPSTTVISPNTLPPSLPRWSIFEAYPRSAGPLKVSGHVGPYSVQEFGTQAIVLSGSNATTGFEPLAIPPNVIIPGATYRILTSDAQAAESSHWFLLYSRWGQPTATAQAQKPIGMRHVVEAADLFVGSGGHHVLGGAGWQDPLESSSQVLTDCYLWVGVFEGPGSVVEVGDAAFINNPSGAVGPFTVVIQGELGAAIATPLAVPDDPLLQGVEVLYQFSAVVGNETIVSDVIGAAIAAPPPSLNATSQRASPRYVSRDGSKVASVREWLRGDEKTRMTEQKQAALSALRTTLRR